MNEYSLDDGNQLVSKLPAFTPGHSFSEVKE